MNWVFIIKLIEMFSELWGDCPEKRNEARRERAFNAVRNQTRQGRRMLLRAVRRTPKIMANGNISYLANGEPEFPRGRDAIALFNAAREEIVGMSDDELHEHIDQIDELYEESLADVT